MLTLDEIHTFYAKSHILHGVSLEVRSGEVVGLLGRNGVGKSTTLKTIMGLVRPAEGRINAATKPSSVVTISSQSSIGNGLRTISLGFQTWI